MPVGQGRPRSLLNPRLEHENEVTLRRAEVMDVAGERKLHDLGRLHHAGGRQTPDNGPRACEPEVPDPPIGLISRMREIGHAGKVGSQDLEAARCEGLGIDREGRA
jgi:hypothetical protein